MCILAFGRRKKSTSKIAHITLMFSTTFMLTFYLGKSTTVYLGIKNIYIVIYTTHKLLIKPSMELCNLKSQKY